MNISDGLFPFSARLVYTWKPPHHCRGLLFQPLSYSSNLCSDDPNAFFKIIIRFRWSLQKAVWFKSVLRKKILNWSEKNAHKHQRPSIWSCPREKQYLAFAWVISWEAKTRPLSKQGRWKSPLVIRHWKLSIAINSLVCWSLKLHHCLCVLSPGLCSDWCVHAEPNRTPRPPAHSPSPRPRPHPHPRLSSSHTASFNWFQLVTLLLKPQLCFPFLNCWFKCIFRALLGPGVFYWQWGRESGRGSGGCETRFRVQAT